MQISKKVYTATEVSKMLGCSPATLRKAIRSGRIHGFQLMDGGDFKIPIEEVERLFASDARARENTIKIE